MEPGMRPYWVAVLFTLIGSTLANPARADFVWEFDLAGVPTTNFIIPTVGGTVDVQIYLKENNGTVLATQGLFGAGVSVSFNSPSGVAAVLNPSDIILNNGAAAFNDANPVKDLSSTSAGFSEATDFTHFVFPDALNRILFGSFRFTAQSAGSVTITATRFRPPPTDAIVTGQNPGGVPLDSLVPNNSASILVVGTATPEPGSLLLASMAGMGLASYGIRRRLRAADPALEGSKA
jgi:hypothetical protein